jgi:hypothetical protein
MNFARLTNNKRSCLRWRFPHALIIAVLIFTGAILFSSADVAGADTITWTGGGGDGFWRTSSNWDLGEVPGSADNVIIPSGTVITCDSGDYEIDGIDCSGTIEVTGGELSVTGSVYSANFNVLTISGGTVNFDVAVSTRNLNFFSGMLCGSGDLSIADIFNWAGGTMSGAGTTLIQPGAVLSISGGTLGRALENDSTVNLNGPAFCCDGSVIIIDNNGTFDIQGDYGIAGSAVLNNNAGGTLTKSAGSGAAAIDADVRNSGTIQVSAGTGTIIINGSYTQDADGIIRFDIVDTDLGSGYNQLQVTGTAILDGTLDIVLDGSHEPVNKDSFTVLTYGSSSGCFAAITGSQGGIFLPQYNTDSLVLLFDKHDSTVEPTTEPIVETVVVPTVTPMGALSVKAGDIMLQSYSSTITWVCPDKDGDWSAPANWDLQRVPASTDLVIIGSGSQVNITTDTIDIACISCDGSLRMLGGTLNISDTDHQSIINSLILSGGTLYVNCDLIVSACTWTESSLIVNGSLTFSGTCTWNSGTMGGSGNIIIPLHAAFSWSGGTMSGTGCTVIESGGQLNITGTNTKTLDRALQNYGSVECAADFWGGPSFQGIAVDNYGVFDFTGGCGFRYSGSREMVFYNRDTGIIMNQAGIGAAVIDTIVDNNGYIVVGAAGPININSNYFQRTGGTLQFEISGTTQGSGYNQLQVAGSADLGGSLDVSLVNYFEPVNGDSFTVLTYGSLSGSFASVTNSGGKVFTPAYNSTSLVLTYVQAPAVSGVSPAGGPEAGGTSVTVTGINFTGATGVMFGANPGTGLAVVSDTSITVTSPAGTGTVDVTVTTPGGTSAVSAGDQFAYDSLSTITWIGGNGAWSTAANWDLGRVPAAGDHVVINSGTVTFSVGTSDIACVNSTGALVISGGTFIISDTASSSTVTSLTLSGGTLNGSGDINVTGTFTWSFGTMGGAGITVIQPGAVLSLSSGSSKYLSRTLQNDGTVNFSGGTFYYSGTEITVNNNGVFDITGDVAFTYYSTSSAVFNNSAGATLKKTGGTGTATINAAVNNSGTGAAGVIVSSGTLKLAGGGISDGRFEVGTGATLEFGGGIHTLSYNPTVTGAGTLKVSGGEAAFNVSGTDLGAIVVSNGAATFNGASTGAGSISVSGGTATFNCDASPTSLTLSGGTLNGSGDINVTGTFTWSFGTMGGAGITVIQPGAVLSLSSGSSKYLSRTLQNDGTVNFSGGTFYYSGTEITVNNNGVFDITGDVAFTYYSTSSAVFNNSAGATLKKTGGTGTATINAAVNNSGTVLVGTAGPIKMTSGYTQGASGILQFDIGGVTQGTGYNQLQVSGQAAVLDASLYINLTGGYTPSGADIFKVITYTARTGSFAAVNDNSQDVSFSPQYNAADLTLLVQGQANPPLIDSLGLKHGSTDVAQMAPQLEYNMAITASDSDTLADVDTIKVIIYTGTADDQWDSDRNAVYTWSSAGGGTSGWTQNNGGVATTWALGGASGQPGIMTDFSGTWTLYFMPGKLAGANSAWNIKVVVTDKSSANVEQTLGSLTMNPYIEFSLDTSSVSFGGIPAGGQGGIADPAGHSLTAQVTTNQAYKLQAQSESTWSAGGNYINLTETAPAQNSFMLCIDNTGGSGGYPVSAQNLGTSPQDIDGLTNLPPPATITGGDEGRADTSLYMGITLGAPIESIGTYEGTITLTAGNQ